MVLDQCMTGALADTNASIFGDIGIRTTLVPGTVCYIKRTLELRWDCLCVFTYLASNTDSDPATTLQMLGSSELTDAGFWHLEANCFMLTNEWLIWFLDITIMIMSNSSSILLHWQQIEALYSFYLSSVMLRASLYCSADSYDQKICPNFRESIRSALSLFHLISNNHINYFLLLFTLLQILII